MKIRFKNQKFQAEAAKAVCDVFAGQPSQDSSFSIDQGNQPSDFGFFTGFANAKVNPALEDVLILEQIQKIQRLQQIEPSKILMGRYNLTVEMETGVGKTYTYIKTMFELNKRFGWSKFIVVVPSVAIREGVYKSFQMTEEHFAEEYNKKIRYFIYNSSQLTEIDRFANDSSINAMIINSQAFNARGKDARRIYMKLDEFRSRRPIDILAATNPIMIIDEPQSVEGAATREKLKEFNPLFTLRYSATHKKESVYNMIYRLDAMEAYNKKLVKKIAVKGITESGSTATEGYVYLESINLSQGYPTATIEFDAKGMQKLRKIRRVVKEGYNLFEHSNGLEEYRDGYTVSRIDGRDNSLEFRNGKKLFAGDVTGKISEDQIRRIQIRETILSHFERERLLFYKGIKVLSLFFIDEVAKYKQYNEDGKAYNGEYADIFVEEYKDILQNWQREFGDDSYMQYLEGIKPEQTHAGYFSIDKKNNRIINSKMDRKEHTSDDSDAYDLIMKDKERLLDLREPVRFIFSHSALREGWDNPNVFQICTLKQSGSEIRKRQEVGRGLRLSVDQNGERMDSNLLGQDVHNVNVLTVIASESYESFAKGLQDELAEVIVDRPKEVDHTLFESKYVRNKDGEEAFIDRSMATIIHESLIENGYVKRGALTDKYYAALKQGKIEFPEEVSDLSEGILDILDKIYNSHLLKATNARSNNIELKLNNDKFYSQAFKNLWKQINSKSIYVVDFDEKELISKAVSALNLSLNIPKILVKIVRGELAQIESREQLQNGKTMVRDSSDVREVSVKSSSSLKYDLVGKIVAETSLTRSAVAEILKKMDKFRFAMFANNPEEFIIQTSKIINDQKATVIIEHITYNKIKAIYDTNIFTEPTFKGALGVNAVPTNKHLFDHVLYDSENERALVDQIDTDKRVNVYVKLPTGFYISTPVGKYTPDWAFAFEEGAVKHIYFVAETKGSLSDLQLRTIEGAKIHCAREHFKAISNSQVVYDVIDSYESLMIKVMA